MDKRTANRLARRIQADDPQCRVTGTRDYGAGDYGLDVIDTRTGISFVVDTEADWEERVKAAQS